MSFIRRFQNNVFHRGLFSRGDKIVVGCSGGPDSVCLARILHKLKEKYNLELKLVHINYGLRGKDSDDDEMFVRNLAQKLELPLEVVHFRGKNKKKNLEENLREFRYTVFEEVRSKSGFDLVAVAHNLDDQVETFFMNLLRGAGLKGLGGMVHRRGNLIRPLLDFKRLEILSFLKFLNQDYRLDRTNEDTKFLRNRIRHNLIPILVKDYNPMLKERVFDLTENLQNDFLLVEKFGNREYNSIVVSDRDGFFLLASKLMGKPIALWRFIFRKLIEDLTGSLKDVSRANFFEFEKILQSQKSKNQIMKLGKIVIERRGDRIYFKK